MADAVDQHVVVRWGLDAGEVELRVLGRDAGAAGPAAAAFIAAIFICWLTPVCPSRKVRTEFSIDSLSMVGGGLAVPPPGDGAVAAGRNSQG